MNLSHFTALTIFAALVSIVFAITTRNTREEQIRYGIRTFISFLAAAVVVGWIMYPFPF